MNTNEMRKKKKGGVKRRQRTVNKTSITFLF